MRYQKGDHIGRYRVLLPLKEANGVETYRVRGSDGFLYALRSGISDSEFACAEVSPLFSDKGDGYVVYRYISGESIEARVSREGCLSAALSRKLMLEVSEQLASLHANGYSHGRLSADNVMLDLSDSEPSAWLIGYGGIGMLSVDSPSADIKSAGALLYYMVYGEQPEMPLRIRCDIGKPIAEVEQLSQIAMNALSGNFKTAREMADCLMEKEGVDYSKRRPTGPGFAAVAGLDVVKQKLRENVIAILSDRKGAEEYGITIPNGMLLYGPPGCGKTFLAERFAEEAAYNFEYVKSSDLASTYLHGSQEKIATLFDKARKNAPTILCFDEFDALVPRRDDINNASQSAEVNEFLSQLNNCGKAGVFVIATSNRPDKIDSAILRTGRIDYKVYIPIPDDDAREAIFKLELNKRPTEDGIDFKKLSTKTQGYIASDISAVVYDAARWAFLFKTKISMKMLLEAVSARKPSLSKADAAVYEKIRLAMENPDGSEKRRRVGF